MGKGILKDFELLKGPRVSMSFPSFFSISFSIIGVYWVSITVTSGSGVLLTNVTHLKYRYPRDEVSRMQGRNYGTPIK